MVEVAIKEREREVDALESGVDEVGPWSHPEPFIHDDRAPLSRSVRAEAQLLVAIQCEYSTPLPPCFLRPLTSYHSYMTRSVSSVSLIRSSQMKAHVKPGPAHKRVVGKVSHWSRITIALDRGASIVTMNGFSPGDPMSPPSSTVMIASLRGEAFSLACMCTHVASSPFDTGSTRPSHASTLLSKEHMCVLGTHYVRFTHSLPHELGTVRALLKALEMMTVVQLKAPIVQFMFPVP